MKKSFKYVHKSTFKEMVEQFEKRGTYAFRRFSSDLSNLSYRDDLEIEITETITTWASDENEKVITCLGFRLTKKDNPHFKWETSYLY